MSLFDSEITKRQSETKTKRHYEEYLLDQAVEIFRDLHRSDLKNSRVLAELGYSADINDSGTQITFSNKKPAYLIKIYAKGQDLIVFFDTIHKHNGGWVNIKIIDFDVENSVKAKENIIRLLADQML
jgi:hypothetical protein